nr:dioxygenase [Burkholderiaceae bacterium]
LSLQPALGAAHHLHLGAALAPLADEGVLVIGSGHLTHNLRELMQLLQRGSVQFGQETPSARYVAAFADWVDRSLRSAATDDLAHWEQRAPEALRAHPTPEHFLPLLVARAAAGTDATVERIDLGVEAQVLAMDAFVFTPVQN